jgi:PTS system glucitol/sorbitol-specific IIA component
VSRNEAGGGPSAGGPSAGGAGGSVGGAVGGGAVPEGLRYATVVTAVGAMVPEFTAEGLLVWFAEGAPQELHEFSVLHRPTVTTGGVAPGDTVHLDGVALRVLAVGSVANANLVQLGHLDLKANGATTAPLVGDVCVEQVPLPTVGPGSRLEIVAGPKLHIGQAEETA